MREVQGHPLSAQGSQTESKAASGLHSLRVRQHEVTVLQNTGQRRGSHRGILHVKVKASSGLGSTGVALFRGVALLRGVVLFSLSPLPPWLQYGTCYSSPSPLATILCPLSRVCLCSAMCQPTWDTHLAADSDCWANHHPASRACHGESRCCPSTI